MYKRARLLFSANPRRITGLVHGRVRAPLRENHAEIRAEIRANPM